MGRILVGLVDLFRHDAIALEGVGRSVRGQNPKTEIPQGTDRFHHRLLIPAPHGNQHRSLAGQTVARLDLGLGKSPAEIRVDSHDFAGALHFRPQQGIHTGKFHEGKDGFLHRIMGWDDLLGELEFLKGFAHHHERS